jgi:hypothetical protein
MSGSLKVVILIRELKGILMQCVKTGMILWRGLEKGLRPKGRGFD